MPHSVDEVIAAIAAGEIVVITDAEDRENEGDLIMAADKVTPEAINFMVKHGRGLICAPITSDRARELGLGQMAATRDKFDTAFTVSVDARKGITTGISAGDRARTLNLLADPQTTRADLVAPGHIFPLVGQEGGVLVRPGHTEAAIDFASMAGLNPAGVICEIMNDDGSMARVPEIKAFAEEHGLKWCTIADLIRYRQQRETLVENAGTVAIPTRFAEEDYTLHCYLSKYDEKEHVAMVFGDVEGKRDVLCRVHSECLTGDVFHSARCDCGEQLEGALHAIAKEGCGVLVYLRQEGRGIGLINKIRAYALQEQGMDTVDANLKLGFPADLRDYSVAAQILRDLEVRSIRLMTNNPDKVEGLTSLGIDVLDRVPIVIDPNSTNRFYLETKRDRLGHLL